MPGLQTLAKLSEFMRERDEMLAIASKDSGTGNRGRRLSAGGR